ncbi:hypothetical protein [Rufibacter roseus]|uniref:Uncharacterized protein n=1 Tax=Rufibacter roseus TaxID=1567108 RepID=A0ABW2DFT0_9BACT|nr:hypothetical protein [Rufibacter roseus]
MKIFKTTYSTLLLLLCLFLGACKEEQTVTPTTGDLRMTFAVPANQGSISYSLYTEETYTSTTRPVLPLRSGTLSNSASGKANVLMKDLNAGNYVFTVGSVYAWSVQVVAGKENVYDK